MGLIATRIVFALSKADIPVDIPFFASIETVKAVCFREALSDDFKDYTKNVITNAKVLADRLTNHGFKIFSGGTDTHLMLIDLRSFGVTGKDAQASLGRANITCNKNGIPFDSESPMITSGIRLGTPLHYKRFR